MAFLLFQSLWLERRLYKDVALWTLHALHRHSWSSVEIRCEPGVAGPRLETRSNIPPLDILYS